MKTCLPLAVLLAALATTGSGTFASTHYVDQNSANPTPPYTNWATAAKVIQDAVEAAAAGDEVVVTNGTYATGGHDGNRVAVNKPLAIRSVNGPGLTGIDGAGSVRCVYLTNIGSISGFTLTNGAADSGAGVFCAARTAIVTNCILVANIATPTVSGFGGGGAYGGTLNNCILVSNTVAASYFYNVGAGDAYGGGANQCVLNNCILRNNSASAFGAGGDGPLFVPAASGGGASGCTLNNCLLTGNSAQSFASYVAANPPFDVSSALDNIYFGGSYGGATSESILNNCTLSDSSVEAEVYMYDGFFGFEYYFYSSDGFYWFNADGGGVAGGEANNCVIFGNSPDDLVYFNYDHTYVPVLNYCCTTFMPPNGAGNVTNAPLFVDPDRGDFRLQPNSPCINAGNNDYVTTATDLDGNPRISGGTVDIGAYEFVFTPEMNLGRLILLVEAADLGEKTKQPLLATLNAALASIQRGDTTAASDQLSAFQNKIRAQVGRLDSALAAQLTGLAQQIASALAAENGATN